MLNIGPQELLLIFAVALIVVGPQRLPALGRSIGRALRELRRAQDDVRRTIQVGLDEDPTGNGPRPPRRARPEEQPVTPAPEADASASEPVPESEVAEITRSLGRGLTELRRAREEIRRGFRIDLGGSPRPSTPRREPAGGRSTRPTTGPADDPAVD
jgi:Tat protein translocase TatB subunit